MPADRTTDFPSIPATPDEAEPDSKWWGQSMTIWGALLTAMSTVLPLLGPILGLDLTPELIQRLGQDLVLLFQALGGVIGTVLTILGNKLLPRVADRYLARTNIEAQQTPHPIPPDRPDYLYAPLPGDRGAHGAFDDQAKARSVTWWLTRNRARLAAGALATGVVAAAVALSPIRRRPGRARRSCHRSKSGRSPPTRRSTADRRLC